MGQAITVGETRNILDSNSFTFEERASQLKKEEENEKKSQRQMQNTPFSRWTQFNNEHTKELMWLSLKHPKANAILLFLVDQMDNYNAVMCSSKVIEEVLGVGRTTVHTAIKVLKENGFIAVLKSGTSNIYAINDTVYWKSWGNKKQYSKFPANVVLSLSEQEESLQTKIEFIKHKEITTN